MIPSTTFSKLCRTNGIAAQCRTQPDHQADPADRAHHVERQKPRVVHFADACYKRGKGSDDRHELRVDNRLPAMPFIEFMRAVEILAAEDLRVATLKESVSQRAAQQKTGAVAHNRRRGEHEDHPPDGQLACPGDHAHREQQRIAWEKEADQQPTLGKHNQKQDEITDPPCQHGRQQVNQLFRIGKALKKIE